MEAKRLPLWLDRFLRRNFDLVPLHRIPEPGITMYPDPWVDDEGRLVKGPPAEILEVDALMVKFDIGDGPYCRSRRGFEKHFSRIPYFREDRENGYAPTPPFNDSTK